MKSPPTAELFKLDPLLDADLACSTSAAQLWAEPVVRQLDMFEYKYNAKQMLACR